MSFLPGSHLRSRRMRPQGEASFLPPWIGSLKDGDLVIADEDGVVIWPKELIDDLLIRAQAKLQQDNARLVQLQEEKTRK